VKFSQVAKQNRNTQQGSVNPSNIAHACRTRQYIRDANRTNSW